MNINPTSLSSHEGVRRHTRSAHVFQYAPPPRLPAHGLKSKWATFLFMLLSTATQAAILKPLDELNVLEVGVQRL